MRLKNSLYSIFIMMFLCIIFYSFLSYFSDSAKLFELITEFPTEIIKAFLFIITAYILRYVRWRYIFYYLGQSPSITKDLLIWFGSLAFAATPLRTGEFFRCVWLKQKCAIKKSYSFSAIFYERITDGISLLLIVFYHLPLLLSWLNFTKFNFHFKFTPIILIILLLFKKNILSYFNKIFYKYFKNLSRVKDSFYEQLKILFKRKIFIISISIGLIAWTFEGISFFILLKGLDAKLNIQDAIVSQLASGLLGALSLMPGGIGTTEASSIAILLAQNININIATSATLLGRLISLWFISFIGFICFIYIYRSPDLKNNNLDISKI